MDPAHGASGVYAPMTLSLHSMDLNSAAEGCPQSRCLTKPGCQVSLFYLEVFAKCLAVKIS